MATNRLEMLKQMVAQDAKNSFARYGLAMEYANSGHLREAVSEFRVLIGADPSYVASYFHAGQALEKLGDIDEAKAMYEQGIEAVQKRETRTPGRRSRQRSACCLFRCPARDKGNAGSDLVRRMPFNRAKGCRVWE